MDRYFDRYKGNKSKRRRKNMKPDKQREKH